MILLIDNYDSFTYNLYQYIGEIYKDIRVCRNDKISIKEIRDLKPKAIVISPGPGEPSKSGLSEAIIKEFYKEISILGICLGHQAIGEVFGGTIVRAKKVMHGKSSTISHEKDGLYKDVEKKLTVMRYHSLVIDKDTLNDEFKVTAVSEDDMEIMSIEHKEYSLYGLQYHPESVFTQEGKKILRNFIDIVEKGGK